LIVPIGTYAASTNFHQPRDTTALDLALRLRPIGVAAHSSEGDRPFQAKATTCSS